MERLKRKHLVDYEYGYIIKFNSDFFNKIYDKIANKNYKELKDITFPFLYEEITENLSFDDNISLKVNLQELLYSLGLGDTKPRLANDLENKFLEEVYKKYYKAYGVEDHQQLYTKYSREHGKIHAFYDAINEEMDEKYSITVFKGFYIKQIADVDIIGNEISNINNEFVNELLESREDSLQRKENADLARTKDMRLLIAPLQKKVNKRKEKTENYYYSFDSWANEFLKQN